MINNIRFENIQALSFSGDIHGEFETIAYKMERTTMDKIFYELKEQQKNITDWYYGHFHEYKLEQHFGINFRLCDCAELNEYIAFRNYK